MDISELIHEEGLAAGYSRLGALQLNDIEHESIKKLKLDHPWAKSIIIAAFHYNFYKIPSQLEGKVSKRDLFKGRYVKGSHEHNAAAEFETCLANAAIQHLDLTPMTASEKNRIAEKMGVGVIRTNGYFYTDEGSYCHLHAWLVDKELTCDFDEAPTACPGHCSICIRNCPEKALTKNSKDTDKCIGFQAGSGIDGFPLGCDHCQDLCPYNKHRWAYEEEYIGLKYE